MELMENHFITKTGKTKNQTMQTIKVYSESKGGIINYLLCNNKETLLWLANLGCIEMHPWYSRVNNYDLEYRTRKCFKSR